MHTFFALTFRGLEAVSAAEIRTLPGVVVDATGYRRVMGRCESPLPLLALKTVDDVFIHAATWDGIVRQRTTMAVLEWFSTQLDLQSTLDAIRQVRSLPVAPTFSVTANFVGKRNYTSDEIKTAVASGLSEAHSWTYTLNDAEADVNLRLFIEHETALVGVRLGKAPLHERAYKQRLRSGTLKPPVAAAMLRLAGVEAGMMVLDPCCGAGTILIEAAQIGIEAAENGIEAAQSGVTAFGGDIDPAAIEYAQANASAVTNAPVMVRWDAQRLPLASGSVTRIVSNLPWGQQVATTNDLAVFYAAACREMRRMLAPGGSIVLLTSTPEWVTFPDLREAFRLEISLFGQTPTILGFSAPP